MTARRTIAASLLALAASGCTQEGTSPHTAAPSPSSSSTVAADLAALLFDDAPPGYVVVPEETRALTLDEAVAGADDPEDERLRLEQHGFVAGFSRSWTSDDDTGNVIIAFVYEFGTADGAKADLDSGVAEARRDGSRFFDVPGIEGAVGITKRSPAGEGEESTFQAVTFVRGARLYLVAIGGPTEHASQEAIDLASAMDEIAR